MSEIFKMLGIFCLMLSASISFDIDQTYFGVYTVLLVLFCIYDYVRDAWYASYHPELDREQRPFKQNLARVLLLMGGVFIATAIDWNDWRSAAFGLGVGQIGWLLDPFPRNGENHHESAGA